MGVRVGISIHEWRTNITNPRGRRIRKGGKAERSKEQEKERVRTKASIKETKDK